jgi:hypothetical protein
VPTEEAKEELKAIRKEIRDNCLKDYMIKEGLV